MEPEKSEWTSPIVFPLNKDGSLRLCIYYIKLNAMTVKNAFSIMRMEKCRDSFDEARIILMLDANYAYGHIVIDDWKKDKTMFTVHHGLYRFYEGILAWGVPQARFGVRWTLYFQLSYRSVRS